MNRTHVMKIILFMACSAYATYSCAHAQSIPFSFDQLYPSNAISRTLNAIRFAYSLAQDIGDNEYDVDNVRSVWLEVYGAGEYLITQQKSERVLYDAGVAKAPINEDMKEHIHALWQLTCQLYDQIDFKDVSLGHFIGHMRCACSQLLTQL